MNKEQASKAYIKGKLRDHQEYLGCEERRRMTLIQSDMYTVQEAFEDGWEEFSKTMIEKAEKWLSDIDFDMEYYNYEDGFSKEQFIEDFKKTMEE